MVLIYPSSFLQLAIYLSIRFTYDILQFRHLFVQRNKKNKMISIYYGVQKGGPSYSPAIYTIYIAYKIDIPL